MASFQFGPVELYLVGFEGDRPDPGTLSALSELVDSGQLRLLDFLVVTRTEDGDVNVTEIEDDVNGLGWERDTPLSAGLVGDEDVEDLASHIEPGGSAVLVALELTYARTLAEKLATGGGVVLRSERIPAPIVNAVVDIVEKEGN